jgi:hypothetical protein
LEQRVLLEASDALLVLVDPFHHFPDIPTLDRVAPYLWHNPKEIAWDPYDWQNQPWNASTDPDGNGLVGDYIGWNFVTNSPNFIGGGGTDRGVFIFGSDLHSVEDPTEWVIVEPD